MAFLYTTIDKEKVRTVDKKILNYGIGIEKLLHLDSLFQPVYIPTSRKKLIKRISVIELKQFSFWIKGEELALTTVENFKTKELQVSLIRDLAINGVACLAFHPGNDTDKNWDIYAETIACAQYYEFPLLKLSKTCTYAEVIDLLYNLELKEYKDKMSSLNAVNQVIFHYLSQNLSINKLLREVAKLTDLEIIILDINMHPVLSSNDTNSYIEMIRSNSFREFMNSDKIFRLLINGNDLIVDEESTKHHFHIHPIKEDELVKQILMVYGSIENPLVDKIMKNIEMVLKLKGKEFIKDRVKVINSANEALFEKKSLNQAQLMYGKLGYSLEDKVAVGVLDIHLMDQIDKMEKIYLDNLIFRILSQIDSVLEKGNFSIEYKHKFFIFLNRHSTEKLHELFKMLTKMMTYAFSFSDIHIGLSSCRTTDLNKACQEAISAVESAKQKNKRMEVFDNISILQLMTDFSDEYYMKNFIANYLEPILNLEQESKLELLATLDAFLDKNLNFKETAERLFVHPNTVRYRIRKLKDLYHDQHLFSNPEKRLNLSFAIKMYDYQRR